MKLDHIFIYSDCFLPSYTYIRYNFSFAVSPTPTNKCCTTTPPKASLLPSFLWKKALQSRIEQEPVNHGWQLKEGHLEIVWTNLAPAPQAVMELVCCGCHGNCQTMRCSCVGNGLPCTEACTCPEDCMNCATESKDGDDDVNDNNEYWTRSGFRLWLKQTFACSKIPFQTNIGVAYFLLL